METLVANIGQARRTTRHGREYVVAPATLIVPGVLNGSKGRLYYSPEETGKSVDSWNGMPLVVYHPQKAGKGISARQPDVIDVGRVYNAQFDGKLKAEAWFDVEMLKAAPEGIDVLNALDAGKVIELSTGLFTQNIDAPPNSVDSQGRPYDYIATNYRPDHLAVLPNQTGACSIRDGCGVLVNTASDTSTLLPPEETTVNKEQLIAWLTTNCACWKGAKDKEVLANFDEAKLKELKAASESATANQAVVNAAKKCLGDDTLTANGMVDKMQKGKFAPAEEPYEDDVPAKPPMKNNTPTPTPTPTENKMSFKEMLKQASPEEQEVWNNAVQIEQAERYRLANLLVANAGSEDAKKAAYAVYVKMPLTQLRPLVAALPAPSQTQVNNDSLPGYTSQPSFYGANGGPVTINNNDATFDKNDVIPVENLDFEEMAKQK